MLRLPLSRKGLLPASLIVLVTGCGWIVREGMIAYIAVDSQLVPKHVSFEIDRSFIE